MDDGELVLAGGFILGRFVPGQALAGRGGSDAHGRSFAIPKKYRRASSRDCKSATAWNAGAMERPGAAPARGVLRPERTGGVFHHDRRLPSPDLADFVAQ